MTTDLKDTYVYALLMEDIEARQAGKDGESPTQTAASLAFDAGEQRGLSMPAFKGLDKKADGDIKFALVIWVIVGAVCWFFDQPKLWVVACFLAHEGAILVRTRLAQDRFLTDAKIHYAFRLLVEERERIRELTARLNALERGPDGATANKPY